MLGQDSTELVPKDLRRHVLHDKRPLVELELVKLFLEVIFSTQVLHFHRQRVQKSQDELKA